MQKQNKSVTAKQVVSKLISQKSICANCGAKKSVFVKEYKPDKKNSFHKLQNMHIYCENCRKHTGNTFQKKNSLDFKE